MPGRDEHAWGSWGEGPPHRSARTPAFVTALSRTLEAESDRLSLWIPVLFAGGILIYFGLPDEPRILHAAAFATPFGNGRRRSQLRCSTCSCPGPRCPPSAPGS